MNDTQPSLGPLPCMQTLSGTVHTIVSLLTEYSDLGPAGFGGAELSSMLKKLRGTRGQDISHHVSGTVVGHPITKEVAI